MFSDGGGLDNGFVLTGAASRMGSSVGNGIFSGSFSFLAGGGSGSASRIGPFGGTLVGLGGTFSEEAAFFGGTGGGCIISVALRLPTAEADDDAEATGCSEVGS